MAGLRRTWDKVHYEQQAKDRLENGDDVDGPQTSSSYNPAKRQTKEEFLAATKTEAGPMGSHRAFLKVRQSGIDLESKVGKTELIAPTDAVQARGAGFWCDVCSCLLKDSSSYLDHINGRKRKHFYLQLLPTRTMSSKKTTLYVCRSKDPRLQYENRTS